MLINSVTGLTESQIYRLTLLKVHMSCYYFYYFICLCNLYVNMNNMSSFEFCCTHKGKFITSLITFLIIDNFRLLKHIFSEYSIRAVTKI
jgi:hypothetical protein